MQLSAGQRPVVSSPTENMVSTQSPCSVGFLPIWHLSSVSQPFGAVARATRATRTLRPVLRSLRAPAPPLRIHYRSPAWWSYSWLTNCQAGPSDAT